jgi:hypothetical protein
MPVALTAGCHMHDVSRSQTVALPKRCPICKGAAIERTSNAASGALIWFHCLFCNHWWKFHTDETRGNPDGELTGEVFIVTKRGITYRLAAVPVSAIPEEVAKKHLKSKSVQRDLELESLQLDIESLTSTLRDTQATEHRLWSILQEDETNPQNSTSWSAAYKKTKNITKEIAHLHSRRKQLTSDEYFFDGLPSGISTARTDADGRFSLFIPREGRYVIAARGPGDTYRDAEPYWLVSMSLDGEASKRLILTNGNVLGARSADCAVF